MTNKQLTQAEKDRIKREDKIDKRVTLIIALMALGITAMWLFPLVRAF